MSIVPSIILFLLLPYIQAKSNYGGNTSANTTNKYFCLPTTCGRNGPNIRFPFRLKTQPDFCGLQGFELSCLNDNTLLHLPSSSSNNGDNFHVQEISYLDRSITITAAHETACPFTTLLSLNLTSSKFAFPDTYGYDIKSWEITMVSCTGKIDTNSDQERSEEAVGPIDCMSNSTTNFVYVMSAYRSMGTLPSHCSIFQQNSSLLKENGAHRSGLDADVKTFQSTGRILIEWGAIESDGCYDCEKSGDFCGFNFTTNSTICEKSRNYCGFDFTTNSTICKKSKGSLPIPVIVGTSIGGTIFFILIGFIIYRSVKSGREKEIQLKVEKFLEEYKTHNPRRYAYSDVKKITSKFKHKLGQGGFGSVYKGRLSNGIPVAVKVLEHSRESGEDFINEMATIGRIHHFNIVHLLGFCSEGSRRAIIYEFMLNGSLEKFISPHAYTKVPNHQCLSWKRLQKIAVGVARGIEYLHQGCKQRILHFDIKPHNILLDHNFQPKISDFGLSKLCSKDKSAVTMTTARGTAGYIAPELFSRNFGEVSYKSDVFSYGMMLLEMVGCRNVTDQSQAYFPEWVYEKVSQGTQICLEIEEDRDEEIAKKLAIVGLWCIQWNPVDRPSMTMVMQMLQGDLPSLEIPPKPFVSSDVVEMLRCS